jgi:proteasome lid subunit RPN8/RPN11
VLRKALAGEIIDHALSDPEREVCGILGGRDGRVEKVYRVRNVAQTPRTRFELHPKDFMDVDDAIPEAGLELIGFYHSHVASSPYPSQTDVENWNPKEFPQAVHFICSLKDRSHPALRAFRFDEDVHLREEPIRRR